MILNGKSSKLQELLQKELNQTVEIKPDLSHRINKSDFVIIMEDEYQAQDMQKVNHLMIVTDAKYYDKISRLIHLEHVCDMMDIHNSPAYLAKRIKGVIERC